MKLVIIVTLILLATPVYAERQALDSNDMSAEIEIFDTEMHLYFSAAVQQKIAAHHWETLALITTSTKEQLPYRAAHLLVREGDHYVLKAAYPKDSLWTLRLILAPKHGIGLDREWSFLDRHLLAKEKL